MTDRVDGPEPTPPPAEPTPPPAEPTATAAPAGPPAPVPATPVVAWEPPVPGYTPQPGATGVGAYADGPPPFTIGALLSDCFARYGADPLRFVALAAVASVLSFAGTFMSLPFGSGSFGRGGDASGLIGLLGFVAGIVTTSAMFALAEGGPEMSFGRVMRRGIERSGWLFLTSILLGLGFFAVFLLAAIPLVLLAFVSPMVSVIALIPLVLVFIWLGLRVSLALPANVADNLNSIDALKISWQVTRGPGVWLRILGAGLLLGLLALPAVIGAIFLMLVAMFGGQPLLLLALSLLFAFLAPLTALVTYCAYRRLVPPFQPSWTGLLPVAPVAPAPAAPDAPTVPMLDAPAEPVPAEPVPAEPVPAESVPAESVPAEPVRPRFRVLPFDASAKAILAFVIALDLAGLAAVPYVVGEIAAGRVEFPTFPGSPGSPFPGSGFDGRVEPGTVAFGTAASLADCTVRNRNLFFPSTQPVAWVASLERAVAPGDEVQLVMQQDTITRLEETQAPGSYDCLGIEAPERFDPGVWTLEVRVNGIVAATGILFVQ
jgi:hypothetical protein